VCLLAGVQQVSEEVVNFIFRNNQSADGVAKCIPQAQLATRAQILWPLCRIVLLDYISGLKISTSLFGYD
jgi:hypothetical protein